MQTPQPNENESMNNKRFIYFSFRQMAEDNKQ